MFIADYMKKGKKKDKKVPDSRLMSEARQIWRGTDKKDKKRWLKMLEPQRQRYIEAYTSRCIEAYTSRCIEAYTSRCIEVYTSRCI